MILLLKEQFLCYLIEAAHMQPVLYVFFWLIGTTRAVGTHEESGSGCEAERGAYAGG